MSIPGIPIPGQYDGNGLNVGKMRAELQQLGTDLDATPAPALAADLVELGPVSAIPHEFLSQAFQALGQALQSGSLKNAQSAYWALQQLIEQSPNPPDQPSTARTLALLADANLSLRRAVQSGDLTGAQQAYRTLRQILQNAAASIPAHPEKSSPAQASPETEADRPSEDSLADKPFAAQRAYLAIQQELREEARIDQSYNRRDLAVTSPDLYSLYLLIAANRLPAEPAGQEWAMPHFGLRIGTALGWTAVNLAILICGILTGVIDLTIPSLLTALFALLVIDALVFICIRACSSAN